MPRAIRRTGGRPTLGSPPSSATLRSTACGGTGGHVSPALAVIQTLREIAAARPGSLAELGRVQGVGAAKLERYGEAMLGVVRSHG